MKAFTNVLADLRTSPEAVASAIMREGPDVQEMFILIFVTYLAAMSNRSIYHEEVEHLILWSREAINALDSINKVM